MLITRRRLMDMLLGLVLCFVFLMAGCSTVHYMETETPAGKVPEASPAPIAPDSQSKQIHSNQSKPGTISEIEQAQTMHQNTPAQQTVSHNARGTIHRFQSAYTRHQRPKIAVFLNRTLSDRVREWESSSRLVISGDYRKQTSGTSDEKTHISKGISAYGQTRLQDQKRPDPEELWVWKFEDGFMHPLFQAGAQLVDRSTIMRLCAASSGEGKNSYATVSKQEIEMKALQGYADLFVEILIAKSPSSPLGYEFKATANEVGTGTILANVTSLSWQGQNHKKREVRATSHGYQVIETERIPSISEVASDLSLELMRSLARAWE